MNPIKKLHPLILVFIACILSRLPQLVSPDLRLDSDECVLALMAKHMYMGKEFPLFFWGQYYGFSLIEELFIIPFYALLGIKASPVKIGMLLLWTSGILFFYKAVYSITDNRKNAMLITLLFIATPAWGLWSMKARGGYLTAHLLSCIVLYLLFHRTYSKKNSTYIFIGVLCYFIFESQPFWLPGLLPLLAYKLYKQKSFLKGLLFLLPMPLVWLPLHFYKKGMHVFYAAPLNVHLDNFWDEVYRFPMYLYNSLHGNYHFAWALDHPNIICTTFAVIFLAIIFLLFINGIIYIFNKNDERNALFAWSTLFIPLTFAYSLLAIDMEYRYLLPVTMFSLVSIAIFVDIHGLPKVIRTNAVVMIIIGFLGVATFYNSQILRSERQPLQKAVAYLEQNDIHYVFCADYTFQWDIMFLSNERVLARFFKEPGRYRAFDSTVDMALFTHKKTAVFGNSDRRFKEQFSHYELDSVYYISENPTQDSLSPLFEFIYPKPY